MALTEQPERLAESSNTRPRPVDDFKDRPLNLYSDQDPDIDPQLRKLDVELLIETARENFGAITSAVLVGGALGFLLKRKFAFASNLMLAFLLQQALLKQGIGRTLSKKGGRSRKDIELERYALKLQRGDYGKMEVIPFK